jgi:hypothetical protein
VQKALDGTIKKTGISGVVEPRTECTRRWPCAINCSSENRRVFGMQGCGHTGRFGRSHI